MPTSTFAYLSKQIRQRVFILLVLLLIFNLLSAQWVSKATALKKRSEVASIVYNGKLYAFLGFRDSLLNIETSVEVYDPALNSWKLLSSLPLNKSVTHEGIALIDDNVWCVGGRVGRHPGPVTSEIWIYNITNNKWSPGPKIIDPATGNSLLWAAGGAAFIGRTLHIFGGFIINGCNNDQDQYHLTLNVDEWNVNSFEPALWKNELAPLPIKRNHFGTVVLGGKIYVIGGQFGHDCGGGLDKQYSHVYNPSTNKWTELPLLPYPRSHIEGSVFAIDGKIYVVAGQGANGANTRRVIIFDPVGNNGAGSWTENTSLLLPKVYEGISAKVINTSFIISHGGQGSSKKPQNTTYSRSIVRVPVYKLGFPSECLNLSDNSASSLKGKTWLFTIDGTKGYTISSSENWLVVTKNVSGIANPNAVDIEVTANPDGLSPGNYNAIIRASGIVGGITYEDATLCVTLTVAEKSDSIFYKLNTSTIGNGNIYKNPDNLLYFKGSSVALSAVPEQGYQFIGWSGDVVSLANPLEIFMDTTKSIVANFSLIEPLTTSITTSARGSDSKSSKPSDISNLPIKKSFSALKFKIYPNPNPGKKFTIEANTFLKNELVTISVFNSLGNLVKSIKAITNNEGFLNREILFNQHLTKGIYLVNVASVSHRVQKKIVIN